MKSILSDYRILIEVNQSYDWNEYYTNLSYPKRILILVLSIILCLILL